MMTIKFNGTQKITAIKRFRQITRLGLKEAKDAVEQGFNIHDDLGELDSATHLEMVNTLNETLDPDEVGYFYTEGKPYIKIRHRGYEVIN